MRKTLLLLAFIPPTAFAQVSAPSIVAVSVNPDGQACSANLPIKLKTPDGTLHPCQNGVYGPVGGGSSASIPLLAFQGYGDSYIFGSGAVNGVSVGGGFAQLARTIPAVPANNNGVPGLNSDSINLNVWTLAQPSPQQASAYLIDGGLNDNTCGTSVGCVTNFQEEVSSSLSRLAIPNQERVFGSACTQTAGTWTADVVAYPIPAPLYYLTPGTAVSTAGTGAILTCTVPSRSASTRVGLNFQVTNAQTGTFTVTVDGIAQTDQCSGTTTFTSSPCAGQNLLTLATTIFRQEFTGTPGTTHTVVVTTTNAAKVDVTAVDTITSAPQPNSNYVVAFGPTAFFSNYLTYNPAIQAVANQFTADGALVAFADLTSTTNPGPGVNATTDLAMTATANCTASLASGHPNDVCGYYHLAQTVVNAAKAHGWNIFGTVKPFNTSSNIPVVVASTTAPSLQANVNSTTVPGVTVGDGTGPTSFMAASGIRAAWGFDVTRGNAFFGGVGASRGLDFYCGNAALLNGFPCAGFTSAGVPWSAIGTAIPSATTIAPTGVGVFHITGTTPIATITPPTNCSVYHGINTGCQLTFIPDGLWTTTTGGNIALATTAVVSKTLVMTYDPTAAKWYPSYIN